jgi:protein-S-isoprenylcysteine O-methyltransferase Ste14
MRLKFRCRGAKAVIDVRLIPAYAGTIIQFSAGPCLLMHRLDLKIPPLIIFVFVGGLMWWAARVAPAAEFDLPARRGIATAIAALGVAIAVAGVVSFRRARTTVNPLHPEAASALVTSGIYRVTRNPMYLGALVVLLAWAAFLANAVAVILAPIFVVYMNRFQIGPEERALTALFGPQFSEYCAKVRRWL